MKIVVLDALTLGEDVSLEKFGQFGELVVHATTSKEQRLAHITDAEIVLCNKVVIDKEIMDQTNIKYIGVLATGVNNIDLDHAKTKKIVVKNAVGYSTSSVIQHTFSTLFYLIEQMRYYDEFVKSGAWIKSPIFTNVSRPFFEISGKKWGIIGLGSIGEGVASIAKSFGCDVGYYSTSGKNNNAMYKQRDLDTLLQESDIISIHAPLNELTKDLLSAKNLDLLKDKAVLLNMGRGGIVNEADLVEALKNKNFYVGFDVLESEPMSKNSPLIELADNDRVCITPHIAWTSIEARKKLVEITVSNVDDFLKSL